MPMLVRMLHKWRFTEPWEYIATIDALAGWRVDSGELANSDRVWVHQTSEDRCWLVTSADGDFDRCYRVKIV
jgi:hypothetical protein